MRSVSEIFQRQARSLERLFVLWVNPYVLFVLYRILFVILPMILADMRFARILLYVIVVNWICDVDETLSDMLNSWWLWIEYLYVLSENLVALHCLQVLHLNAYDVKGNGMANMIRYMQLRWKYLLYEKVDGIKCYTQLKLVWATSRIYSTIFSWPAIYLIYLIRPSGQLHWYTKDLRDLLHGIPGLYLTYRTITELNKMALHS